METRMIIYRDGIVLNINGKEEPYEIFDESMFNNIIESILSRCSISDLTTYSMKYYKRNGKYYNTITNGPKYSNDTCENFTNMNIYVHEDLIELLDNAIVSSGYDRMSSSFGLN